MVDSAMVRQLERMVELQKQLVDILEKKNRQLTSEEKIAQARQEKAEQYNTSLGKAVALLTAVDGRMGKFKRFSYGFLPKGFFRAINALSSGLEQIDSVVGRVGKGLEKTGRVTSAFGKSMDFTQFDRMSSQIKAAQTAQETYFGRSTTAAYNRRGRQYFMTPDAAERQLIGRQKAEKTLRRKRALEVGGLITGIRRRQEPAGGGIKKAAKQFIDVLNKTDFGKIFQLIKKHVVRAAILVSAVIFKTMAFVVLFYMIFKAFGPQIMDALKATWEAIKAVGMVAMAGLMVVWDGLKDIWSAFFGDGDLVTLIDGLLKVAGGLLLFVAGLAITAITAGLVLLGVLLKETGQRVVNFIGAYFSSAMSWVNRIAVTIALVAGYVAFVISGAWAAMIAAAIGFYVAKKLAGFFGFHADGGTVKTPMQIVGERGPELVSLPRGSRVHTNAESKRMAAGGGNTFNITINARDTSDAELRRIADKIGQMINGRINRTTSSRTLGA